MPRNRTELLDQIVANGERLRRQRRRLTLTGGGGFAALLLVATSLVLRSHRDDVATVRVAAGRHQTTTAAVLVDPEAPATTRSTVDGGSLDRPPPVTVTGARTLELRAESFCWSNGSNGIC